MQDDSRQLNLFHLLVENSLGLMCIHDMDGNLLSTNPAVLDSLGYSQGDPPPGPNLRDYLVPSVRNLLGGYLERIRTLGSDSGLMRLQAKDGSERIWFYRNKRFDAEGEPPIVLGHALDITESVRAEQALKEARTALQEAHDELAERVRERTSELQQTSERLRAEIEQRKLMEEELLRSRKLESLGVLAGGIAHDLNNFLTIIQGNVELAKLRLARGDGAISQILDQIGGACQRGAALASQLLTFAKGGAPLRRIVSIAQLVRDAVNLARAGAPVTVEVNVADDLWPAEADAGQIAQVLHNVLLNARESMPGGGVMEVRAENFILETATAALQPGRYVRILVRDFGSGIAAAHLSRIFDPYFTTKQGGSGLGLATAYAIVNKHQGNISVRSADGVGTTVTIDLPASDKPIAAHPFEPPPPVTAPPRYSGRILLMDDEEPLRRLIPDILEPFGFTVECAKDGAEAIALYERASASLRPFDVVVLDLTVRGGMGGVEAARKLKEMDPGVTLIVSSGYSDDPVLSKYREYGFEDVIPKPWIPSQIGAVVGRAVMARDKQKIS